MQLVSLIGSFEPPGDKSISHRIAIFSLLGEGGCLVENYSTGKDCLSSLEAVRALGVRTTPTERGFVLEGAGGNLPDKASLDCGNSGTTMRLLMGALASVEGTFVLDGDESLRKRPMGRVARPLEYMGARIECTEDRPPVTIHGGELDGIDYTMPVASAQLKSALLLAGVRAAGITNISEPAPSRDHTERMLALCGGPVEKRNSHWRIRRASLTLPEEFRVPGDASSAAFFPLRRGNDPRKRGHGKGHAPERDPHWLPQGA